MKFVVSDRRRDFDGHDWSRFFFHHGNLGITDEEGDRVIPPPCERELLIEKVHHDLQHVGAAKMLAFLKKDYWWPGMSRDVKAFTRACLGCAL